MTKKERKNNITVFNTTDKQVEDIPIIGVLDVDNDTLTQFVKQLDPFVHTIGNPYCDDPTCPCHEEEL